MPSTAPARSAGPALTNANSSCSPVPSAAVTDGRRERRRVAVGNNQNGSARLWEQRRCSQRSSGWIPPRTSAGGCLERARGGLEQRFNLWFNPHLYWGVPGGRREPSPCPAWRAVLLPLRAGTLPLRISSAFANHELMHEEPDEPPPGQSPQTSVTVMYGRGDLSPSTHPPRARSCSVEGPAPPGRGGGQDALPREQTTAGPCLPRAFQSSTHGRHAPRQREGSLGCSQEGSAAPG